MCAWESERLAPRIMWRGILEDTPCWTLAYPCLPIHKHICTHTYTHNKKMGIWGQHFFFTVSVLSGRLPNQFWPWILRVIKTLHGFNAKNVWVTTWQWSHFCAAESWKVLRDGGPLVLTSRVRIQEQPRINCTVNERGNTCLSRYWGLGIFCYYSLA